jgi:tRNA(adenine34) deaminase
MHTDTLPHSDDYWMQRALQLAARAEALGEVPVGAVVVCGDQLVGEGWNQPISSCDPTAHAEIMALRQAAQYLHNYRLPGCRLYITLEPCTMCAGAMIHARIDEIIFAATEPKAGVVVSNACVFEDPHYNHRVRYRGGVLAEAAAAQLQAFFRRRRQEAKEQAMRRKQAADE